MATDRVDREAPTPRLTGTWAFWRDGAQSLVEDLCRLELTLTKNLATYDRPRAEIVRSAARTAALYAALFARWNAPGVDVPTEQKAREQDEFRDLAKFCMRLLGRVPAP